jgi:hypothetical protein
VSPSKRTTQFYQRAAACLLTIVASCAAPSHRDNTLDAGRSDTAGWSNALTQLETPIGQIHSFLFYGDPRNAADPTALGLRVDLHMRGDEAACGLYSDIGVLSQTEDFWYLQIDLSQSQQGSYQVVYDTLDTRDPDRLSALVTLLHRKGGAFVARYHALAGEVRLADTATLQTWKAGNPATMRVDALFPEHAVQTESCRGGAAADGTQMIDVCSCVDAAGVRSMCSPAAGRTACCEDTTSKSRRVTISVRASQCPAMCRTVAGAPNFCSLLF